MRYPVIASLICAVMMFAGCATRPPAPDASAPSPAPAGKSEELPDRASLREAQMLGNEHRYAEAAAIYEKLLKSRPKNGDLTARLASMISMQAKGETDPAKAQALNKRARAMAEQAEKLGTNDPMPPMILASTNPDGSALKPEKGVFSKREEVDQAIRDGEAAYNRHDFAKAAECYQKAYELEPTNYMAALWTGDAYFGGRQMVQACEWFRKAIAVAPDRETAHRYLGDALAKLGRREEAYSEWIAALLCEPYQRTTRQHFDPRMRVAAERRGRVIPRFPEMRSKIEGKKMTLAIDPNDGALMMAYNVCAVGWREENFAKHFPTEKTPRRSLLEEVSAIEGMLEQAEKSEKADVKKWQTVIDGLTTLKREGLLEAFIFFERADEGLAKDYVTYRAEHQDKLERYIRLYWCGFE